METPTPDKHVSLGKLTITLFITAVCSQSQMFGLQLLFKAAMANFMNGNGSDPGEPDFAGFAILLLIFGGPLLLGLYLKPGWRGLFSGFVGLVAMVGGGILLAAVSSVLQLTNPTIRDFLLPGLVLGLAIVVIMIVSGNISSAQEKAGLRLGVIVGTGVSVVFSIAISHLGLEIQSRAFLPTLPILWIWLSAVFLPELLARRTDWRGILIWIAMMLISPIVIVKMMFVWFPN